ncbi:MAG: hypothetical protein HUK24_08290 [Sphaerochaetaceae bacterium]|nr:hypothetical protein [Sphaerochaetaceae bacterium]
MYRFSNNTYYEDIDTGRLYKTCSYSDGQTDVFLLSFYEGELKETICNPREIKEFLTTTIDNCSILSDHELEERRLKSPGMRPKPYWEDQED